jgi:hypothetical protein
MEIRKSGFLWLGVAALVLSFGLVLAGCNVDGDDGPTIVTYKGIYYGGVIYTLTITDDAYVLTVGDKTSSGSASKNGGTYTLTPSVGGDSFRATVNDNGGITGMNGYITFDDGSDDYAPPDLVPLPSGDNASDRDGLPSFTDAQLTLDGYTGGAQDIMGIMTTLGFDNEIGTSLGKIGSISDEGKITWNLPATVAGENLAALPEDLEGNIGKYGVLKTTPALKFAWYWPQEGQEVKFYLLYCDRNATIWVDSPYGYSIFTEGWQLADSDSSGDYPYNSSFRPEIVHARNFKWELDND